VTYLTRSHWGAAPPVKTLPISKHLKGVAIHWMGFHVGDDRDPLVVVKSIQSNHMAPGKDWYDIAYNELISLEGDVIEGRGLTVRCGANGSAATNKSYIALGLLIGPGQAPTEAMVKAVRERIAIVQHFQPQANKIVGHKDLKPTDCPGPEVSRMIRAGFFDPSSGDLPDPPDIEEKIENIYTEIAAIYAELDELNQRLLT